MENSLEFIHHFAKKELKVLSYILQDFGIQTYVVFKFLIEDKKYSLIRTTVQTSFSFRYRGLLLVLKK
jgi:hypothetical protein